MTYPSSPRPRIFSFFAGAGFLDLGFEHSGFEVRYVNEWHRPFLTGYIHSRRKLDIPTPRWGYSTKSIEELSVCEDFAKAFAEDRKVPGPIGFIGGPPCPDFSVGGKNRGEHGENGRLSKSYVELILSKKPDYFLFENVKGLYRTKKHREFFEAIMARLSQYYSLHERLINSIEYGAPQDRERIILVGFLKGKAAAKDFSWSGQLYPNRSAFEFNWPKVDKFENEISRCAPPDLPIELTVEHWFLKNEVERHPNARHCFVPRVRTRSRVIART